MTDESKTIEWGVDAIVLNELPLVNKPTVGEFIQIEGTKLVINPKGQPCDEITDPATARAYAYAASRLVAGFYYSLAPRKHTFSPPTGPLTLNRGVYKAEDGQWYMLDSKDGYYIQTKRPVKIAMRELAHDFNDELCKYKLVVNLANQEGEWRGWAQPLTEVMNAKDRDEAKRILNEHIQKALERTAIWKATGRAVREGNIKEVKSLTLSDGVDVMAFTAGNIRSITGNFTFRWSAKSEWAVGRALTLKEKGHELVFEPPSSAR